MIPAMLLGRNPAFRLLSGQLANSTYVAQEAVEVLSRQDRIVNQSYVAQEAVEVLSKQARIVNQSFVAQEALEVLSKKDRIVNTTYLAQFSVEVLSWPATFTWPVDDPHAVRRRSSLSAQGRRYGP
jgi:hypothetical protein